MASNPVIICGDSMLFWEDAVSAISTLGDAGAAGNLLKHWMSLSNLWCDFPRPWQRHVYDLEGQPANSFTRILPRPWQRHLEDARTEIARAESVRDYLRCLDRWNLLPCPYWISRRVIVMVTIMCHAGLFAWIIYNSLDIGVNPPELKDLHPFWCVAAIAEAILVPILSHFIFLIMYGTQHIWLKRTGALLQRPFILRPRCWLP